MKHHQPAKSAYAPLIRNEVIHPVAKRSNWTNQISFAFLLIILKFWDTPTIQAVLRQISATYRRIYGNSVVLQKVVDSSLAQSLKWNGKFFASLVIKFAIRVIELSRLNTVGIIDVPSSIRKWSMVESHEASNMPNECQCVSEKYIMRAFQKNRRDIDNVLHYWFGRFSPEKAQKQLWMIASSSKEHLERVDAEIVHLYERVLVKISRDQDTLNKWLDKSMYSWQGKMAAIIVLDQMSRHVHRYYMTSNLNNSNIFDQRKFDELALEVALKFQEEHKNEISCGMVPVPMMIFALMPLRHKSTMQSVGFVQEQVEKISDLWNIDMQNMIRRFRRASNRRMAVLQDEARKAGRHTHYDKETALDIDIQNENELKKSDHSDNEILEFQFFETEMTDAINHPVVKTMIQYLADRNIFPSKENGSYQIPVIVSLSGGVDSMVIANILSYLRDEHSFPLYIVAVHIDYGNRPESSAEANFVKRYALDILKLDKCTIRRINEVTRGVTKRDEYELISRNVRYDLYRQTVSECMEICKIDQPSHIGVMLGHHKGDVVENVISNSNKGSGPLDLSGMTALSTNDGVTIYRPLLPLQKTDIFNYSHKYGIPYFKDTTPHWSTRGKLRNKLIPLLEEVYGDGCLNNLASLAEESDEARALFNKTSFRPFMDKVQKYPLGIIFSTQEFRNQGFYFWKIVLRDMLHSCGLGMFSDGSIETFLKRALAPKITAGWLQCRKDYGVFLMSDGHVAVLYPDSFPWRKEDYFQCKGQQVAFGELRRVGPWEVKAELVAEICTENVLSSWENFMKGEIRYSTTALVSNSGVPSPLHFVEGFTKITRPLNWKGVDVKIQSTLPLLGSGSPYISGSKDVMVTLTVKRD
jgi:tRNA(Ile)-lysidine synthetase-like protein